MLYVQNGDLVLERAVPQMRPSEFGLLLAYTSPPSSQPIPEYRVPPTMVVKVSSQFPFHPNALHISDTCFQPRVGSMVRRLQVCSFAVALCSRIRGIRIGVVDIVLEEIERVSYRILLEGTPLWLLKLAGLATPT